MKKRNYIGGGGKVLGILLGNVTKTNEAELNKSQLEEIGVALGGMPFKTCIRQNISVEECKEMGVPLNIYKYNK